MGHGLSPGASLSLGSLQRPCFWPCHSRRSGVRTPACLFSGGRSTHVTGQQIQTHRAGSAAGSVAVRLGAAPPTRHCCWPCSSSLGLRPGSPAPGQTPLPAGRAAQLSAAPGPGPLPSVSTCSLPHGDPGLSHAGLALQGAVRSPCPVCASPAPLGTPAPTTPGKPGTWVTRPAFQAQSIPALLGTATSPGIPEEGESRPRAAHHAPTQDVWAALPGHRRSRWSRVGNPGERMSPVSEKKVSRGRISFVVSRGVGMRGPPPPPSSQGSWLGAGRSGVLGQNPDPFSSSGGSRLGPEGTGAPSVS